MTENVHNWRIPCPFCGSTDIEWTHCGEYEYTACGDCGAQGPVNEEHGTFCGKAEELWKQRPIEIALYQRIADLEEERRLVFDRILGYLGVTWDETTTWDELSDEVLSALDLKRRCDAE